MAEFGEEGAEVNARIVYWGVEGAGKATNLQVIHSKLRPDHRGELRRIPTRLDPSAAFTELPIELGQIGGVRTRIQIVAVPGAPEHGPTRKQLLDQVDGIVFVVDPSRDRIDENLASFEELRGVLAAYGRAIEQVPLVIQYNKRGGDDPTAIEELHRKLSMRGVAAFEAAAADGTAVLQTLTTISKRVIRALRDREEARATEGSTARPPAATSESGAGGRADEGADAASPSIQAGLEGRPALSTPGSVQAPRPAPPGAPLEAPAQGPERVPRPETPAPLDSPELLGEPAALAPPETVGERVALDSPELLEEEVALDSPELLDEEAVLESPELLEEEVALESPELLDEEAVVDSPELVGDDGPLGPPELVVDAAGLDLPEALDEKPSEDATQLLLERQRLSPSELLGEDESERTLSAATRVGSGLEPDLLNPDQATEEDAAAIMVGRAETLFEQPFREATGIPNAASAPPAELVIERIGTVESQGSRGVRVPLVLRGPSGERFALSLTIALDPSTRDPDADA